MSPVDSAVEEILQRYPQDATSLIMVLQDIQSKLRYIPEEAINAVAKRLDLSSATRCR